MYTKAEFQCQPFIHVLLTFSYIIISHRKLGVQYDPKDMDAFVHMWRVIGHMMGIEERSVTAIFRQFLPKARVNNRVSFHATDSTLAPIGSKPPSSGCR